MQENKLAKIELVGGWLLKAKNDLLSALKLGKPPDSIYETAIYHCQQSAEKSLKGFLVFHDAKFEKTHDLESLFKSCIKIDRSFSNFINQAGFLNPYSIMYRYPGDPSEPSKEEFDEALKAAKNIYNNVVAKLRDKITIQTFLFDQV